MAELCGVDATIYSKLKKKEHETTDVGIRIGAISAKDTGTFLVFIVAPFH